MPLVSFIIPAYNASLYLSGAIESILHQTISDWEMIIIDDHSSDSTLEIAVRYAESDPRIRVIARNENSGSAYTPRLDGIKAAKTTLIAPLDADDTIPRYYLESLLRIRKKSRAEVVYPLIYFLKNGNTVPALDPENPHLEKVIKGRDSLIHTLDGWRVTCNGGIIPRKLYIDAFRHYGQKHNDVNSDESLTRWILFLAESVIFTTVPYYYREHPESITHIISPRRIEILNSCIEVIALVAKYYPKDSEEYILAHKQLLLQIFNCLLLIIDNRFDSDKRAEALDMIEKGRDHIDFNILKGRVSRHLWSTSQWPMTRLLNFVKLRHKVKSGLRDGKIFLAQHFNRLRRRIEALKIVLQARKEFRQSLNFLKKGILPPGSESESLYNKFYIAPDYYAHDLKPGVRMIVCPFDGRIIHGGTTDRLRGVLSTYAEAKRRGIPFRIAWTTPFQLEEYLEPASFDWRISPDSMIWQKNRAYPIVIQDKNNRDSDVILNTALDSLSGQLHVYSNSDSQIGTYRQLYQELFKPTKKLSQAIDFHKRQLGKDYFAFCFRFTKLLGDFYDSAGEVLLPQQQEALMERVAKEFQHLSANLPEESKILLTSDSKRFLDYMENKDRRIYIVKGNVLNVDLGDNPDGDMNTDIEKEQENQEDAWMKMFIDQQLIMGAKKVWRMTAKGMYPTGFPRFAAEVGGAEFIDHRF